MDVISKNMIIVSVISIVLIAVIVTFSATVITLVSKKEKADVSSEQEVTSSQNEDSSENNSTTELNSTEETTQSQTSSNNQTNTSSNNQTNTLSTPSKDTSSKPQSNVTPNSKPSINSNNKPNNIFNSDTSSSTSSSPVKTTVFDKRPEKNVKSFEIINEFTEPTYQKKIFKDSKSGKELRYCLYLPEDYTATKKYPVLLFMHGMGNIGTNYVGATNGIKPVFTNSADIVKSAIIIAPQAPDANGFWPIHNSGSDENGWGGIAMRLLLDIEKTYSCDKNRIYVTGNSMGGHGTWNLIETYSDHFAAAIPICGWGNPSKANNLKDIPIWIYHGDADPTVPVVSSRSMYNAIKNAGSTKIHYTELPGVQHDSWTTAYSSRELMSWLFSQSKATNPTSEYETIPFLKVYDNSGNIIISENDTSFISFTTISEIDYLELMLTNEGAKKLEEAYKKSNGKTFTVYYGNIKIMTFTATTGSVNKTFYIPGAINSYNYYEYLDKIDSYKK